MASSESIPAVFVNGLELTPFEDGSVKLILAEMNSESASPRGCFAIPFESVLDLAAMLNEHIAEIELSDPDTVVN